MANKITPPYGTVAKTNLLTVEIYTTFEGAYNRSRELSRKGHANIMRKVTSPGTSTQAYHVIPTVE